MNSQRQRRRTWNVAITAGGFVKRRQQPARRLRWSSRFCGQFERILQELSFNRTIVNDINFSAIRYASSVPEK
jgi:hypothetical protein